ncbi:MAG TPA: DMT family transporter [Bacteroidia bacterium]|nr:DMT family transporter [Bacteroidia bacterium]HQW17358.1 DMT family transporter [Bacteroidia bacterium]HQW48610.1 DMT family transporter [Bacteroidia bacterium]HQX68953.1 DMT family transporter [Bacteroidia bacterium]HQZ78754.1 DMT family transporter [Bacteroidia bacterium]
MKATTRAHLSVLFVNLLYAANFSIAKQVMPEFIKPFGFIVIRVIPATVLFFLAAFLIPSEKIKKKDRNTILLCALFGVAINQLLFFKGLSLTSPINGALIMTTNPVLVLLMAAIILKEPVGWIKYIGITLGIAGAMLLILLGKNFNLQGGNTEGDLYIFLNSVSFAIFIILVKPLMLHYHPITVMKWTFFFGALMVLPFGFNEVTAVAWSSLTFNLWLCILFVIVAVTFVAYLMNVFALRHLSPSVVSIYIYFQPVFATLISMALGEASPGWLHLASAVLIFTGVYLVSKQKIAGINNTENS